MQGIKKITRAMEMVSFAKLNQIYKDIYNSKEYLASVNGLVGDLLAGCEDLHSPLVCERPQKNRIMLCVITSDTGLCGNYNNALIRIADKFITEHNGSNIDLIIIGRKAYNYFKKTGRSIIESHTDCYGHFSAELANKISSKLIDSYLSGRADEVYIAYALFESSARHKFIVEKILNIEKSKGKCGAVEYLFEPDMDSILDKLLPLYIKAKIRAIILNAFASEHSTRVMAMGEANENAGDLLDSLTLMRNRVRQAGITTEITEVVASADALRG